MDTSQITALLEQANEFIKKLTDIQKNYISKINSNLENLENTINDSENHSETYTNDKIERITKNNEQLLDGFNKKIKTYTESIKNWYDKKVNAIKLNLARLQECETGISVPEDTLESLANAIPHPELPIPEVKIELPEFEIDTTKKTTIPRIPLGQ